MNLVSIGIGIYALTQAILGVNSFGCVHILAHLFVTIAAFSYAIDCIPLTNTCACACMTCIVYEFYRTGYYKKHKETEQSEEVNE